MADGASWCSGPAAHFRVDADRVVHDRASQPTVADQTEGTADDHEKSHVDPCHGTEDLETLFEGLVVVVGGAKKKSWVACPNDEQSYQHDAEIGRDDDACELVEVHRYVDRPTLHEV